MYNHLQKLYAYRRECTMRLKASEFRRNLFSVLDHCLESGEPIEVERRQGIVEISPLKRRRKVAELPHRPDILVDGDALDSFSPAQWKP